MTPDCLIRIREKETGLPYRELSTLKQKIHQQAKELGLRTDTNWKSPPYSEGSYYYREYYNTANNPVIATIMYLKQGSIK